MCQVSKAACLAQSMVSQGFQLDADTLVGLVTACGHAGVWEPAQTLCAVAHSMQVRRLGVGGAACASGRPHAHQCLVFACSAEGTIIVVY